MNTRRKIAIWLLAVLVMGIGGCRSHQEAEVVPTEFPDNARFPWDSIPNENLHWPYVTMNEVMRLPEPADYNDVIRVFGPPDCSWDNLILPPYEGRPTGAYIPVFLPTNEMGWPTGEEPNDISKLTLIGVVYGADRHAVWGGIGTYVYPARMRGRVSTGFAPLGEKR
jgi:hypothetical protein